MDILVHYPINFVFGILEIKCPNIGSCNIFNHPYDVWCMMYDVWCMMFTFIWKSCTCKRLYLWFMTTFVIWKVDYKTWFKKVETRRYDTSYIS